MRHSNCFISNILTIWVSIVQCVLLFHMLFYTIITSFQVYLFFQSSPASLPNLSILQHLLLIVFHTNLLEICNIHQLHQHSPTTKRIIPGIVPMHVKVSISPIIIKASATPISCFRASALSLSSLPKPPAQSKCSS